MAILRRSDGTEKLPLPSHCLVGRAGAATLRIDDALVSTEHALLRHRTRGWTIRDHQRPGVAV